MKCCYQGCENQASYYYLDDPICEDCFQREVYEYGESEEDFEPIIRSKHHENM